MMYEFECQECGENYEELSPFDETGAYESVVCPKCGSGKKVKLMSLGSYRFVNPIGTDKWNNSHDYRFKHNLPNVQKERQEAMEKSHMGTKPYRDIDDISSGKNFGEVK
jgi:putative FmdB family regulatory protein